MYAFAEDHEILEKFLRWIFVLPFSLMLTIVLFSVMVKLISEEFKEPIDEDIPKFDAVIYKEKIIEIFPGLEPIERPIVDEPPDTPDLISEIDTNPQVSIPPLNSGVGLKKSINIGFNGTPVVQYMVAAKYPRHAISREIEGFVDVQFDITKIGTTKNIHIIRAEPEGVFEKTTLAAVRRWRYQPRMQDGVAVAYLNMAQRIRFELAK